MAVTAVELPPVSRRQLVRTRHTQEGSGAHRAIADLLRELPGLQAEVLYHAAREAVRNAARHGRPAGSQQPLAPRVMVRCDDALEITVADDGVGLDARQTDGAGQGLALHSTMMAVIGGTLRVDTTPGAHTRVTLSLPASAWQAG